MNQPRQIHTAITHLGRITALLLANRPLTPSEWAEVEEAERIQGEIELLTRAGISEEEAQAIAGMGGEDCHG